MTYPEPVETRVENRSDADKIAPMLQRILKQIAAKEEEVKGLQARVAEIEASAEESRTAGDYRRAFRLDQDAQEVRKKAERIKAKIRELDDKHAKLLNRARSGSIEYR